LETVLKNELQVFTNSEFGELGVIEIEGKLYFPATKCAKILGYSNQKDAISRHCRWVVKRDLPHPQNPQKLLPVNFIPEGDLYRLIARSNLASAERFERWIFDEVLPQIRRTGGYVPLTEQDDDLAIMCKAFQILQNTVAEKDALLSAQTPKVQFADAVQSSDTTILIRELAKLLAQNGIRMGQNRLFAWLRENEFLIRAHGTDYNAPTQKSIERDLMRVDESIYETPDGRIIITRTPRITGKGQQYFLKRFLAMEGRPEAQA